VINLKLNELLTYVEPIEVAVNLERNAEVKGVTSNSKEVMPGYVFFCIKGTRHDGHEFVYEAFERKAAAIVCEKRIDLPEDAPIIYVSSTRRAYAMAASALHGFPSRFFKLVGVTGTNGKTTTTFMLESTFKAAGYRTGLIGTVVNKINDVKIPVRHTTPDPVKLQELFKSMKDSGVQLAAMEVSSHAIDQQRIAGTSFDVLVFTNLSQDHLDYHGSLEEYARVKSSLFFENPRLPWVINIDDLHGRKLFEIGKKMGTEILTYGFVDEAMIRPENVESNIDGINFKLRFKDKVLGKVTLPLTGKFNIYNALAAFGAAYLLGIDFDTYVRGIAAMDRVPGRFEVIRSSEEFYVVVDYAHTPDGLQKVTDTCLELLQGKGRLVTVFGCGGDRDRDKRPKMGRIAAERSAVVILTSDNPRSEDPEKIIQDILSGIPDQLKNKVIVEVDRKKAIFKAIETAKPGDIVLIAGKGHETYQIFKDRTVHFDDREVALEALAERGKEFAF